MCQETLDVWGMNCKSCTTKGTNVAKNEWHSSVSLKPHADLVQVLSSVVKEVKDSVDRDINGTELLHSLLNTSWLKSLLKVSYVKNKTLGGAFIGD